MTDESKIQLAPGNENLMPMEAASNRWDAKIPMGVSKDALLQPAFWAHHARHLKPFDEIRAHNEDGTWVAYFIVLDCSRTYARVQLLQHYSLSTGDIAQTQAATDAVKNFTNAHKVVWRGPRKWSVVRQSDDAVLAEDITLKDEAISWLDRYARQQSGAPVKLAPVTA
jgi:hypothetical protein